MSTGERNLNHPVWDVYDQLRTARLNVKYYSALLSRARRWNLSMEFTLAVAAPGSAVAGLWFWDTGVGNTIWKYLAVLTAVVAVAKPLLKTTDRIRQIEKVLLGYRAQEHDLQTLTILIRQDTVYGPRHRALFEETLKRRRVLVRDSPETIVNQKLRRSCQQEVEMELPADSFYVPSSIS